MLVGFCSRTVILSLCTNGDYLVLRAIVLLDYKAACIHNLTIIITMYIVMTKRLKELLGLSSERMTVSQPLLVVLNGIDPLTIVIRHRVGETLTGRVHTVELNSLQEGLIADLKVAQNTTVHQLEHPVTKHRTSQKPKESSTNDAKRVHHHGIVAKHKFFWIKPSGSNVQKCSTRSENGSDN